MPRSGNLAIFVMTTETTPCACARGNNRYSDVPQCRAIGKNELLIPSKSTPFPVWRVVGTDIDRCIININMVYHVVYTYGTS